MKTKNIIIAVLLFHICSLSFAQWNWINPNPFGYYISDVFFSEENTGYIVGESGLALKTIDAGLNWNKLSTGTSKNLNHVWFTNNEIGYATGEGGILIKTSDGGETWFELQTGINQSFNDIFFVNDDTGFLAGMNGNLLRTTDAGNTWNKAFININIDIYSLFFLNENVGYAVGSMNSVFKTINGGNTWMSTSGEPYLNLKDVYFLNENFGYIAGNSNFMMKTNNGGYSWNQFQSNLTVTHMHFIDELNGFALAYNELVKTVDGGITWNSLNVENCCSFFYDGSNIIHGVGFHGKIFKSDNAGLTFQNYTISVTDSKLVDVHFPDENTGYIVGQYNHSSGLRFGQVLKSTNAGTDWQIIADDNFDRPISIYFTDEQNGYMVTEYGKIYKCTDGGYTWEMVFIDNNLNFSEVFFINQNIGLATCDNANGKILRTNDAGNTWITVYENFKPIRGIHFIDENTGFAITSNTVLKTINGGLDWIEILVNNNNILLDVFFVNQQVGYVCGFLGDFYKTIDGGENWINLSYHFSNSLVNMFFVDENIGYMSGDGGSFFQTNDGGATWANLKPSYLTNTSIWFTDKQTGIAVGDDGNIFKTTNGGLVFSKYKPLSDNNFTIHPNPANSKFTISNSKLITNTTFHIQILDNQGKIVWEIKNQTLPFTMDSNSLAQGLYFIYVKSKNTVEIIKLVKI